MEIVELLNLILEINKIVEIDEDLPEMTKEYLKGYNAGVERVLQDIKKIKGVKENV